MNRLIIAFLILFGLAPAFADGITNPGGSSGGGGLSPSGTFNAGDIVIGGSATTAKDSLFFGTIPNGGISLSGGGTPAYGSCYWNDTDTCTTENIRARERMFIGNAVLATDNRTGNAVWNATWFGALPSSQQSDSYLVRDAQFAVMGDRGTIGIFGGQQCSLGDTTTATPCIGIAGYVYNDTSIASANAWGAYLQAVHAATASSFSFGAEIETRNTTATNTTGNPYAISQGDIGLWVGAGAGQGSGTGAPNPSVAAMVVLPNTQTFNSGIIFKDGSLTKDGSSNSVAIAMGQGATLQWQVSSAVIGANLRSTVSTSGDDMSLVFANNQIEFQGPSGGALVNINASPSTTLPTLEFATCGTNCGLLAPASNQLEFVVGGAKKFDYGVTGGGVWTFSATLSMGDQTISGVNNLLANTSTGYELINAAASSTVPTLVPSQGSTSTGFGAQASGNISAIVANVEVMRFASTGVLLVGATPTAAASQIGLGNTTAAASSCNVTSPTPAGCLVINVAGTVRNIPFY